jgi:pyruvate formate lyase activating enzyme
LSELTQKKLGLVFEIQKMSTEDGPGIRTTIFLKHCPLKCEWCHNPESISKDPILEWLGHKCIGCKTCLEICKQNALSFDKKGININREKCIGCGECSEECPSTALHLFGKWWTLEDLFEEIEKDKVYYTKSKGGITISGGEPTLQPEFVREFLKKCKKNGISTALDTCGYASKKIYDKILPFVDLILLDVKEISSTKHKKFTGVANELILENAKWFSEYVRKNNKRLWIRTPIIPGFTATKQNVQGIGEFIVEKLENIPERWDLLSFNNLCQDKYARLDIEWRLKDIPLIDPEKMEELYEIAKETGVKNVHWSGLTKKPEEEIVQEEGKDNLKLPSC